jgi:DNA-binding response OmpR family regulator
MPSDETAESLRPRVLLILPEQWPRALLRAALREDGYDALGAPGLPAALHYPTASPGRGAVRLILVDQAALGDADARDLMGDLLRRHGDALPVLLARARPAVPHTAWEKGLPWLKVIRRPVSLGEVLATVRELLPLPPGSSGPVD